MQRGNAFSKTSLVFIVCLILLSVCAAINRPSANSQEITSPLEFKFLISAPIAVLPIENLSDTKAPIKNIRKLLITGLKRQGFNIIDDDVLEGFMSKHRIRYTGAINQENAEAFKKEGKADAVLITSVELYSEQDPPKISIISRLTSTGSRPEILWMDSIVLSGDDSPGILGLGLIEDPMVLLQNALKYLSNSLIMSLSSEEDRIETLWKMEKKQPALLVTGPHKMEALKDRWKQIEDKTKEKTFVPGIFYRSPILSSGMKYRIAVMPFLNKSDRKNAGDIMSLLFVNELRGTANFEVIEPGLVREDLLRFRVIMNEGISFENAGIIFSTLDTDADLILSGTVLDYQDYKGPSGTPKVDFSVLVIEKKSREVVWTSKSYRTGDKDVIFFDKGMINVANPLASRMVRGIVQMLLAE